MKSKALNTELSANSTQTLVQELSSLWAPLKRDDQYDLQVGFAFVTAYSMFSKEIKLVHPKGNQLWIFIEKTDAKAEAPILWPFDAKSQLIGKDPDAGKDWRQKEKRATEDEMVK